MNTFGERLRELRNKRGLSAKETGAIFGLAQSTISGYESGDRQPDFDTVLAIAKYFGVSTDYLLGNKREIESADLTPEEAELLEELKKEAAFYDFLDADEDKKREIIEGLKLIIRGGLYKRDK
ncbi:helix-turn-helix domain-containing protein [Alicyclobacillus acidoterrestris]|uniref:Helix-turn-helix transcriptional regulator n=1 Tax=Alicyclobacillus acidoterrestris (strain ATCC 49025 / DSM 3922 / CIP 106132 / NCIMB 13137 / GD3B) TaxID=1356854 RepID=T0BKJ7_ALIAG|nr:helix-turn-helix transcriptional regulator [Alicyclobacillus acidoterrestris]EPZ41269.1 XRE family transcriptional regulator [Alicyclobacillus acidoterrestris ATCC 49025]UNO49017.1 helix-turn-helix transcriptional regulator [Alicyclobacillus acidoterrestris]